MSSQLAEPPGTFGPSAKGVEKVTAEALKGWILHRHVHMAFDIAGGVATLGITEVLCVVESSTGDSANGLTPQVTLLNTVERYFHVSDSIPASCISVHSGMNQCTFREYYAT